jgi:hypothetical protein
MPAIDAEVYSSTLKRGNVNAFAFSRNSERLSNCLCYFPVAGIFSATA